MRALFAQASTAFLASNGGALALVAAVLLVAFVVNRFAPRKRKRIRRMVILLVLFLVASAGTFALGAAGAPGWAHNVQVIRELLAVFTVVNVVGLLIFDIGLSAIKVEISMLASDLATGVAYIVATLAVMRGSGVDLSGIVATSAVVTGILALSLQATLGNVVGGLALQLDNSIRVGDWIQLENGKQGRVREIRWRHTVIVTRDWDTIIVPNASLLAANILILGKREGEPVQHRMWVHFNVDFRYNPADVIQAVEEALQAAPIEGVAERPPPHCVCLDFARENKDSFGYYVVRYWLTDLARDDPTSSRVRERIYAALKRAAIPLAVPAAQIWVEQDSMERRERKHQREVAQRKAALASVEFLKALRDDELAKVAERLRYAPFSAGETITKQGAVAHWLYIVADGTAEVRVSVDGQERAVAKIGAPGFFGEMGLMTGEPRTATVVAVTDVDCYRIDKEAFHQILADRPEIAAEISGMLAQRRVELQAAREDLDAVAKQKRVEAEKKRILSTVQLFFGLGDDERRAS